MILNTNNIISLLVSEANKVPINSHIYHFNVYYPVIIFSDPLLKINDPHLKLIHSI